MKPFIFFTTCYLGAVFFFKLALPRSEFSNLWGLVLGILDNDPSDYQVDRQQNSVGVCWLVSFVCFFQVSFVRIRWVSSWWTGGVGKMFRWIFMVGIGSEIHLTTEMGKSSEGENIPTRFTLLMANLWTFGEEWPFFYYPKNPDLSIQCRIILRTQKHPS